MVTDGAKLYLRGVVRELGAELFRKFIPDWNGELPDTLLNLPDLSNWKGIADFDPANLPGLSDLSETLANLPGVSGAMAMFAAASTEAMSGVSITSIISLYN